MTTAIVLLLMLVVLTPTQASDSISELCRQHLDVYQNSSGKELWAMQMLDSWTKLPSGLLYGVYMDLGNYDECLSIKDIPSQAGAFGGKYCLVNVYTTPEDPEEADQVVKALKQSYSRLTAVADVPRSIPTSVQMSLTGAFCLPSSCSPTDFMIYLNDSYRLLPSFLPLPKLSFYSEEKYCTDGMYDAFRPIDWGAVAFLIIFAIFAVCSTAYDLLSQKAASRKELFLAFSWYSNGKKLFSTRKSSQDISCLHGIRFLSMVWVLIGHRYAVNSGFPSTNLPDYSMKHMEGWGYIFLHGGTVSVDTFFLLSGVLIAYVFLNGVHRGDKFNIGLFYLHRYIRLTPALAVIIFLDVSLYKYTGSGPLWKTYSISNCDEIWWNNLLYLNNYLSLDKTCIGQGWYLAVDMQLFWLSPLVLIPLWKKPKLGKALLVFFTLAGLAICFGICYHYEIVPFIKAFFLGDIKETQNFIWYYYYSAHMRFTPWLLGIALGYFLHEIKKQPPGSINLSMVKCIALWSFAAFFMLVTLCGTFPIDQIDHEKNVLENAFFNTFHRPVWALGVALMILACSTGHGGPVNTFLSWSFFLPLSRLTYVIYLIHITMQYIISVPGRTLMFNDDMKAVCDTISDLVLCTLLGIVFCLLFESPFIVLEKVILGFFGVGKSANNKKKQLQESKTTEKKGDLEAATIEGTKPEDVTVNNKVAAEVGNGVDQNGHYMTRPSEVGDTVLDVSSTSNLLPH